MITNNGMKLAINRITKSTPDYTPTSQFQVGMNQTTPTITDTTLTLPVPINNTDAVDTCEVTTNWNATTDGSIATNATHFKEGSYSLTLIKSGVTQTNVTWYNQSETTRDFTAKDIWGWIYILDATTLAKLATSCCLEVRYGNDYNTNYYKKTYNASDLAVGWNYIKFNTTTGTQVGTVTLASCDSLAVKLTLTSSAQTLASGDICIDDFKLAAATNYHKNFESGYPTINETNFEKTDKGYLNYLEANGFLINGFGTFNTDTSILLSDIFKFTSQSKSNIDEYAFYIKTRLTRR